MAQFPAGGGILTPLNITLPAGAFVLNASLSLEGQPSTLSGGRTDTTDEDFGACEGLRNVTISDDSVRLSRASGSWAQGSDAAFRDGRAENVEIDNGVRLARCAKYAVMDEDKAISPFRASQLDPAGALDSKGNLFLVWEDLRSGTSLDILGRRLDPSNNPLGPDIVICDAPNHQTSPALAIDGSDNMVVLWQDARSGDSDIYGRRYDPSGSPLGNEFVVCNADGEQCRPAIAIGPQNKLLAAWDDFRNGKNFAVRTILLNSDGTQAGLETVLSGFNADQMAPSVCTIPGGYALVCQNSSNLTGADLQGYLLDAQGSPGAPFNVCNASFNQSGVRLAAVPGGKFAAVWEDRRGGEDFDIFGRWFDPTGAPAGGETALCVAVGDQRYPSLSINSGGDIVVAWEDGRGADSDVYFKYFDSSWNPKGSETLVCGEKGDQNAPAAAMASSVGFCVAWSDWRDGLPNIRLMKFGSPRSVYTSGSLVSTPIPCYAATFGSLGLCITLPKAPRSTVNTTGFQVDILDGREDYIVQPDCRPGSPISVDTRHHDSIRLRISMWTADENITPMMARWSVGTGVEDDLDVPNGGTASNARVMDGQVTLEKTLAPATMTGDFPINNGGSQDFQPSVAKFKDGSGSFVAAWQEKAAGDKNILARKFYPNGTPMTGQISVCDQPGVQENPSVAVDQNGQFTVVWSDNRSGRDFDVFGRRFDPQGNPAGAEFLICGTSDDQKTPRVTTDLQNNILVVWTDSTKAYILTFMRKFSPEAAPLYPVTQVSWTQWNLVWPSVDTDGEGRIYVAWGDFRGGTGGNYDIYAAAFYPDCRPVFTAMDVPVCVKVGDQMNPDMSVDMEGNFVVAWEDWANPLDANIYGRKFDRNGTALTGEFPVSINTGAQMDPDVEFDSRGNFLAVYMTYVSAYDIFGRYFGSNGAPLGPEFVVCNTPSNEGDACEQQSPAMCWGPGDEFVVAWEDRRTESPTGMDVWAKACGFPNFVPSGTYLTPVYDLLHAPLSLDEAGWNGSLPPGTTISAALRTSPDRSSWSALEGISQVQTVIGSPPARFVQWQFGLSSSTASITPVLQGLHLSYTTYATNGTLVSLPLDVPFCISGLQVLWNADLGGGALAVECTQDNGTHWVPCPGGEPLSVDTGSGHNILRYRAFLYSNGSGTPVIDDISMDYSATSYPLNTALDLGGDENSEWDLPGIFNGTVKVAGLEKALNALLGSSGNHSGPLTIPLVLRSDSAGIIGVSNLSVTYDMPPVILSAVPALDTLSINETEQLRFAVNAADGDGDELHYVWMLNGRVVGNDRTEYVLSTDHSSSGNYTVGVSVSDLFFTVNRTWHLRVLDLNRLPIIDWYPRTDLTMNETEKSSFWVAASDPDGANVSIGWYLDGKMASGNSSYDLITDYNSSGAHTVSVKVSDGIDTVQHNWTVTVLNKNRPPVILRQWPAQETVLKLKVGNSQDLRVDAFDPDGERLVYIWKLNGQILPNEFGLCCTCRKGLVVGANTVRVEVSDGNATASTEWTIRMSAPPVIRSSSGASWAIGGVAVLVILVIVALLFVSRRKRQRTGPG